eukprot:ANDGO_01574.mRNA.1 UPF0759 protein YunF
MAADLSHHIDMCCGMCSWTPPALISSKKFYPSRCRTGVDQLQHYATELPCVEVDSSNYAMPTRMRVLDWQKVVPRNFIFHFKIFQLFTFKSCPVAALPHEVRSVLLANGHAESQKLSGLQVAMNANEDEADDMQFAFRPEVQVERTDTIALESMSSELQDIAWNRFKDALEPLHSAGQLGCIVFQFPPSFSATEQHFAYVAHCYEKIKPYKMAVEFRDRKWYDLTLPFIPQMRAKQIVLCISDDDALGKGLHGATTEHVTCNTISFVRLHRRAGDDRMLSKTELEAYVNCMKNVSAACLSRERRFYVLLSTDRDAQTWYNIKNLHTAVHDAKDSTIGVLNWKDCQQRLRGQSRDIMNMFAKSSTANFTIPGQGGASAGADGSSSSPSALSSSSSSSSSTTTTTTTTTTATAAAASSSSTPVTSPNQQRKRAHPETPTGDQKSFKVSKITSFFQKQ